MQNNEQEKKRKPKLSVDERLELMKAVLSNAKLPKIQEQIAPLGFTVEKLDAMLEKIPAVEALSRKQKKEYAEKYSGTDKADKKREEISKTYMKHLSFARILFKDNVKATTALELSSKRKLGYSAWFVQVRNFYSQLLENEEFLNEIKTINIQQEEVRSMLSQLNELAKLKEAQKKETAEAQKATVERDRAFEPVFAEFSNFMAYAKVALQQEQDLEALGVIVRRD